MTTPLDVALQAALAVPVGARMEQVFHAPFVTVLLAERDGGEPTAVALEFARDALARRGVAPGRQMVLLATTRARDAEDRDRVRALRARLGIPVVLHDPQRSPSMPGSGEGGLLLELDDELREAEAVLLVSALRPGAPFGEAGGDELLLPGAASAVTAASCAGLAGTAEGRRRLARIARSVCRIDFALLWKQTDPSRAWAGEMPDVLDVALAALAHDDVGSR